MMAYIFGTCLAISIIALLYVSIKNYNNIDSYFLAISILIPISLLGYTVKAQAVSEYDARLAFCFIYLDSTVLLVVLLFSLMKTLGLRIQIWMKILFYGVSVLHLATIWLCRNNTLYYKTFNLEKTAWGTVTTMTAGPLKFTHYIWLVSIFMVLVGVVVYCAVKKKDCSKRSMHLYASFIVMGMFAYALEMIAGFKFSVIPFLMVIGDVIVALEYTNIHCHDMERLIVEQQKSDLKRGYVAFDLKKNLLGYNDGALRYAPGLKGKRIDSPIPENDELYELFYSLIDTFIEEKSATKDITKENMIFRCTVKHFSLQKDGKNYGYLIEIDDVTAEQGYMNLIKEYGKSLEKDVSAKTDHIRDIQQRTVLGMATIIENRDMNTGGHVKRTSDIICIIVNEMRKQNIGDIDDKYADHIIRSAPMHDLGKISIDNAILNKPGRLTEEEYAIMKTHSAKSGQIVKAILTGIEEEDFVQTAYRLARFHHERWDGKGYPERLTEYEIPLEARIMAIADVYDALVSKRVYKEPMSFEQAAKIMLEGMGTQFDPMMKPVFEGCREQLEDYYTIHNME